MSSDLAPLENTLPDKLSDSKNDWLPNEHVGFWAPMLTRESWRAVPPTAPREPLRTPVCYVRFAYTNTNKQRFPDAVPALQVYQKYYMIIQEQPDMPYNFLIDSDGVAYEVAGWHADALRPPELADLKGNCLDIAYIGDFSSVNPPWAMIRTATELIKFGIMKQVIDPKFEVIPFRDLS